MKPCKEFGNKKWCAKGRTSEQTTLSKKSKKLVKHLSNQMIVGYISLLWVFLRTKGAERNMKFALITQLFMSFSIISELWRKRIVY